MKAKTGLFINFEGLDGSGKTTLIKRISEYFKQNDIDHIVTREPGGTKLAEHIRSILKHGVGGGEDIDRDTEMMLFNAARSHHVNAVIKPALGAGKVVLCDRFADSTFAYQGAGRGLDIGKLMKFHHDYIGLYPDVTFLMDGDPSVFIARVFGRGTTDPLEKMVLESAQRIRDFYLRQADESSDIYVTLDATKSEEEVFNSAISTLVDIKRFLNNPEEIEFIGV